YRSVIQALKQRGLKPYTTLWHFTLPQWFAESGGFERSDSPVVFARYAKKVAEELGEDLIGISTINEPNVFASLGWIKGAWPPFKKFYLVGILNATYSGDTAATRVERSFGTLFTYLKVSRHLAEAHNQAYDAIKSIRPAIEVSVVKHTVAFEGNWNPLNKLRAYISNYLWTVIFMNRVHKKCDQIGLNFYHYRQFGDTTQHKKTEMNWDFRPEKIRVALRILARYQKPIFVSEAGLADADDSDRTEYITRQVQGVYEAITEDGIDVRGHMYWSLLDNYEWAFGFTKRFGLIEINYDTLERTPRPSAYVYKTICEQNGLPES
ncbi:MAG: family 1 glycosylhydrolase, partial [Bacteroidota bacterium]